MIVVLENPIRSYDWGSLTALPELRGVMPTGRPQAELWAGAHPGSPSTVAATGTTLDAHLATDPDTLLGRQATARFGDRLPYLLKILTVERPLSIQVHPTVAQAEQGYAADEAAGVPLAASNRRYRDRSHKPEMVVALTAFDALLGFAQPSTIADRLTRFALPGLAPVESALRGGSLQDAAGLILEMPSQQADALAIEVTEVAARSAAGADQSPYDLIATLAIDYPADRGILLALMMDHVRLGPGEAVFVPSGVPHAYLHGVAVEPQASSDNTLRAGLTPKHVDIDEVAKILRYEPGGAVRIQGQATGRSGAETVFRVPADEFVLTRWELPVTAEPARVGDGRAAPWIVLVTAGEVDVGGADGAERLRPGQAAFVPASDAQAMPELRGRGVAYGITTAMSEADG